MHGIADPRTGRKSFVFTARVRRLSLDLVSNRTTPSNIRTPLSNPPSTNPNTLLLHTLD